MIISYEQLGNLRANFPHQRIALVKGSFDLFHYAHLKLLEQVKAENDILVVEVKCDADVRAKGHNRPIISELERASIVDAICYTDYSIIANQKKQTPELTAWLQIHNCSEKEKEKLLRDGYIIQLLQPDSIYATDEKPISETIQGFCSQMGVYICVIPTVRGRHTTEIIRCCKELG